MKKLLKILILCSMVLLISCKTSSQSSDSDSGVTQVNAKKAANYNMQLGLGYLQQGNRLRAKRKLLTALKQAPNSAPINSAMAFYLETSGQYKEAEKYYRNAIQLATSKGAQFNNYGAFLCRRGRYELANDYFLKASKDMTYVNSSASLENAGLCSLAMSKPKRAKKYFIQALQQDPRRAQSLRELVNLAMKKNDVVEAERLVAQYKSFISNQSVLNQLTAQLNAFKTKQLAQQDQINEVHKNDKQIS